MLQVYWQYCCLSGNIIWNQSKWLRDPLTMSVSTKARVSIQTDWLRRLSIPSNYEYLICQKLNRMYTTRGWRYNSSVMSGERVCSNSRVSQINQTLINQVLNSMPQCCTTICIMTRSLMIGTVKIGPESGWGRLWWWSRW